MLEEKDIESLIIRFLEKEILEDELHELEAWLLQSPENKSFFFDLKNIYESSHYNRFVGEEKTSWERFHFKLNEKPETAKKKSSYKLNIQKGLKYVAIVCVAFSIGWFLKDFEKKSQVIEPLPEIAYNIIQTEDGGKVNSLVLSDGSKVTLGVSTSLRYPASFGNKREVYLDGEAFFDVKEDTLKPFIVKLKQQDITVLGTTFNVEGYSKEAYSNLTLLSGRVLFEAYNEAGEPMSRMYIKPNQKAYANNETGSVTIEDVDVTFATAWLKGEYKFKNEPLDSIFMRLEKYYGVKINFKNEKLKSIRYTGTFSLNQTIQEVLNIINHNKQFAFQTANGEITIKERRM